MSDEMLFEDEAPVRAAERDLWQVLIVDDEESVHQVTKLVMADFKLDGRGVQFTDCYSAAEARLLLAQPLPHGGPDSRFALILLDVVMEHEHAGLDLVRYIREELRETNVRIVLRTGQPGQAPQAHVIRAYDINDYREKTDLTHAKLTTVFYAALRAYRDLMRLERARNGLRRSIHAITQVCDSSNLRTFCSTVLEQASELLGQQGEGVCASRVSAYAAARLEGQLKVLAVTAAYAGLHDDEQLADLPPAVRAAFERCGSEHADHHGEHFYACYYRTRDGNESFLYMRFAEAIGEDERELLSVFSANVAITYEKLLQREALAAACDASLKASRQLFDQADGRLLAEAALRSISASTARSRGGDFLRVLVKDLAEALDVTYVIAGRVITMEDGGEGIRTLAVWGGADYLPNMEYGLLHTPCQDVTDQSMCFHACGIQADYPKDTLLVDMNAESYIGMPMIDTEGRTLGILSAIDTKPIDENKRLLALSLLSIFAARGAAELQHQEREAVLEAKVLQRTEALRAAQASLVEQEKMAALGALVAGVAHEVNTPIGVAVTAASGMSNYTDKMVEVVNGAKVSRSELVALATRLQGAATLVEQNLARAAELIGSFKQLAVDQGSEHVGNLKLRDYVLGVVSAHSPELRKAGIQVVVDIDAALHARLAAGRVSQVISNLLMNAAKHAYPHGGPGQVTIGARIEVAEGRPWMLLDVADDGIGLTPEVRARLFEPFFTTKRGQGGSGLGMHIVYTIVHQLGGTVAADPGAGQGCRIHVRLPLAAA
jgi:signal transduction histidine kinase/CheY-like chemotaxis protein